MKQPRVRHKRNRNAHEHDLASGSDPAREDRKLDEALEDTFPASDPPAQTQPHDTSPGSKDDPRRSQPGAKKPSRALKRRLA